MIISLKFCLCEPFCRGGVPAHADEILQRSCGKYLICTVAARIIIMNFDLYFFRNLRNKKRAEV